MATVSSKSSPYGSPAMPPSPVLGLKKVLSNRSRSIEMLADSSTDALRSNSIESLGVDKSPTRQSTRSSISRDGSTKSGSSGMRKLLPGHSKRKRKQIRDEELKAAEEEMDRGRSLTNATLPPPLSRQDSTQTDETENSLLTDDSELDTPPPLVSRHSHAPYLTTSSPLIKTSTNENTPTKVNTEKRVMGDNGSVTAFPPLINEPPELSPTPQAIQPEPHRELESATRADTLKPDSHRGSISKLRAKSPARKLRDVFSRSGKSPRASPRASPERESQPSSSALSSPVLTEDIFQNKLDTRQGRESSDTAKQRSPSPLQKSATSPVSPSPPVVEVERRPITPPPNPLVMPITTVTPPSPSSPRHDLSSQDTQDARSGSPRVLNNNVIVSPSGNMITHRRIRSDSASLRGPSKLSNSMTVPLTPPIEESRTPSATALNSRNASSSFFSSWVSAAQNAANTFTNLTGPGRTRTGTNATDPAQPVALKENENDQQQPPSPDKPQRQLAVETLGSGELSLGHLGLEDDRSGFNIKTGLGDSRKSSMVQRDEAAAKIEGMLAQRAVSAAYEKSNEVTPVAELPDLINPSRVNLLNGANGGEQSPPNGSIVDSEVGSIKRSGSVRSKIANRRSRGSSIATGQSAIGAIVGSTNAALANPASGPRLSGFALAPKQRNRAFHQLFRSVPEDDFLVEDYSCALQREILLAGRIYISEGHICFSSNILGWSTTLVISFEEVVSIEREYTAMIIPNAIAVQTLHARHTFRSLLTRDATYDLLIGIWKVSHPASFQKSVNGKQLAEEEAKSSAEADAMNATGRAASPESSDGSEEGDSDSDGEDDDDDGSAASVPGSGASFAGSEPVEVKTVTRKTSNVSNPGAIPASSPAVVAAESSTVPPPATGADGSVDFPGPATHPPTDCTDSSTHYDKIIKDEVIPAPLGKIYSLLYGPQSGVFVRKYLVDDCKSQDLAMEDDKKGLNNDAKSRQYTYIKPLGGAIGPKQTKCITTENLDFFDLEKSVSVTCSTQTPDVPSGNAFTVKTRYCLSWAPGNATRLQMNCTIEWSAKSWLKGPIEKGANDGQQQYGDGLVKALKAAVGRPRGATSGSKISKAKKKRKGEKRDKEETRTKAKEKEVSWGVLEPLRGPLGPVVSIVSPVVKTESMIGLLFILVAILWYSGGNKSSLGIPAGYSGYPERLVAYEELWRREESDLWNWLEARSGVDAVILQERANSQRKSTSQREKSKQRQKILQGKDVEARLREEKMSQREMEDAIRITKERLAVLEGVVERRKSAREAA